LIIQKLNFSFLIFKYNENGAILAEHKLMMRRVDKTFPDTTLLERLPGAQRLGRMRYRSQGCSREGRKK
jgi:hypothetical protein